MSKNKNKARNNKPVITESALLKSLNELEEAVLKSGDALLEQDPEGSLSTEGESLADKAPKGKGSDIDVTKADDESSDDDDESEETEKSEAPDDDDSDDDKDDSEGDDSGDEGEDSSDDDDSSPEQPMKKKTMKSLRQRADEDETMSKAIEVSDFISAMVDQTSESLSELQKAFAAELSDVDDRLSKAEQYQRNFNGRLAAGLINIGKVVESTQQLVKSLLNQPNVQVRKSILNAGEVIEPHRRGDEESDMIHPGKVASWLMNKAMAGEIDSLIVTQFEVNQDIAALPMHVRKALVNDLQK